MFQFMKSNVFASSIKKFKIRNSIIYSIFINMMNCFLRSKNSTKMLFHYKPMFKNIFITFISNHKISIRIKYFFFSSFSKANSFSMDFRESFSKPGRIFFNPFTYIIFMFFRERSSFQKRRHYLYKAFDRAVNLFLFIRMKNFKTTFTKFNVVNVHRLLYKENYLGAI